MKYPISSYKANLYSLITNILKELVSYGKRFSRERNPLTINFAGVKVAMSNF